MRGLGESDAIVSLPTPRDRAWRAASRPPDGTDARESDLPACGRGLRAAVATSRGASHVENEDSHSPLRSDCSLFVVADGVGGGAQASRASRELVERLHAALDCGTRDHDTIRAALLDADRAIERSIGGADRSGAATVALCAAADAAGSQWLVAWVGDCRIYHVAATAGADARPITVDDTYRNLGETAPDGGSPEDPARMIGNGAVDAPNVARVRLDAGEMLAIVSDGVHKHATDGDVARTLHDTAPLATRCERLIALARSQGSRDDATVLVVHREAASAAGGPMLPVVGVFAAIVAAGIGRWVP